MFSLANGIGQYALAPDGQYNNYAMESVSHDWHLYDWGILNPPAWRPLLFYGMFIGALQAVLVIPVGLGIALVAFMLRPSLRDRCASWKLSGLLLIVALVGFLSGVAETIIRGLNPGIA